MRVRCDWVVTHDGTKGPLAYAMECLRCGTIQKVAVPISVDCYVAMGEAFLRLHRGCRTGPAGAPGAATPGATEEVASQQQERSQRAFDFNEDRVKQSPE